MKCAAGVGGDGDRIGGSGFQDISRNVLKERGGMDGPGYDIPRNVGGRGDLGGCCGEAG